jgi:hypothetical protein
MINDLTPSQLRRAADIKDHIENLQRQLATVQNDGSEISLSTETPLRKKRKFSAAGLARLRAAQKARWAKVKEVKPAKAEKKTHRKMSTASKAKIAAAAKARWAKVRAGKTIVD